MRNVLVLLLFAAVQGTAAQPRAQTTVAQQPVQTPAGSPLVVIVAGWTEYHYPECPRLKGITENLVIVNRGQASARGLKPHDECDPARSTSTASAAAKPPARASSAAFVYIVRDDRRYHLATCPKLGLGARGTHLDLLAKRYVPCPICKPPARKPAK